MVNATDLVLRCSKCEFLLQRMHHGLTYFSPPLCPISSLLLHRCLFMGSAVMASSLLVSQQLSVVSVVSRLIAEAFLVLLFVCNAGEKYHIVGFFRRKVFMD